MFLLLPGEMLQGQELSHPLSMMQGARPHVVSGAGTVNVLAVMVQFQTETDSLISGNGRLITNQGTGLDAPPHDKTYFENHLLFLKNYFGKVSGGKLNVDYTVLDSVITLPHQMKYYSPPKTGTGNNLGLLTHDSWHAADSIYDGSFPFNQYQCFVIFHAGSGGDLDFTTTLGYNPYPYNLPSIYLDSTSLQSMTAIGPQGISVDGGTFHIRNSIIMPEWESYSILELTLGTNGLLAASFGSFLGLPDLFDTKTGVTGIGRFGLMDGQSIFAFGGIFPPEPSAWEKIYLGWITPITISPSTSTLYQLYANEIVDPVSGTSKYSVIKVPINATEYFLLENREGDAHHDGGIVTSDSDGVTKTTDINFTNDTTYFDGEQIKNINGVVTDADEYDWALPEDTTYFGGVLIWHIDQSVIDQNIATNTVNANPDHRGVALMEAHGANEIGNFIQTVFGSYYYDGSPYDFWYKGNPDRSISLRVGGNNFTPESLPNSDGYNDANSHVYITNFSNHDSVMSFYVTADSIYQVVDTVKKDTINFQVTSGFPKNIHGATLNSSPIFGHISSDDSLEIIANNGTSLYAFKMSGTSAGFDSTGFFSKVGGKFQPVISSANANDTVYAMDDSVFYGLVNNGGTAETIFATKDSVPSYESGLPLLKLGTKIVSVEPDQSLISVFSSDGKYLGSHSYPLIIRVPQTISPSPSSADVTAYNLPQFAAIDTSNIILKFQGHVVLVNLDNDNIQSFDLTPAAISYATLAEKGSPDLVQLTSSMVYVDTLGGTPQSVLTVLPGDTIASGPIIADLDGDGNRDIIFATQTKVYAISYNGAVLNHFPISTVGSEVLPSDANRIVGSMVVAKLNGDTADVIFGTKGGTLYAYDGLTGQLVPGFPLSIGGGLAGSPAVTYDSLSGKLYLAAIGLDSNLYCWTFAAGTGKGNYSANSVLWGNLLHDNYHMNSITEAPPSPTIPPSITDTVSLMPKVYNWPNPVTNGTTKIRFYLNHDAQVSISIFSFAGNKVADLPTTNGTGGTYKEADWNVGGVQSGVYFARVEAVSSKERDVKIIKIAVVK